MSFPLLAQTMKCGSVVVLLVATMSWHAGPNYQLVVDWVVSVGAIMVVK
jgi:hypothetical protein